MNQTSDDLKEFLDASRTVRGNGYCILSKERLGKLLAGLHDAFIEGRNVLPGATDDQAAAIERWAKGVLAVAPTDREQNPWRA